MAATKHEFYDTGDNTRSASYDPFWEGESFTVGSVGTDEDHDITKIVVLIFKSGSPPATLTYYIYAVDGSGLPTGSALSTGTIATSGLSTSSAGVWEDVSMSSYTLQASTQYAVVQDVGGGDSGNFIGWRLDTVGATYGGGNRVESGNSGSTWANNALMDYMFEIWGEALGTNFQINVDDAFKEVPAILVNVDDAWKTAASALVNVDDAWKTIF